MPIQLELFDEMIERFKLHTIIELGLYRGGLANILMKKQPATQYYGFEFVEGDLDPKVRGRAEITIMDVNTKKAIQLVENIVLASSGPVLIFCDTFDKPREMQTYSKVLRVGDFIQGHDYPGDGVTDEFLERFGAEHPDLEELEPERIRKQCGTTIWRKIV